MIFQDVRRQVNLLKNSLSSSRHIIFKIIVILLKFMDIDVWTYTFEPPGPAFSDSTNTKHNWNEMSSVPDLKNYPYEHEVLGAIVYFTGPFANTSNINVNVKFYNNNTGTLLFEGNENILTPASQGWAVSAIGAFPS